MQIKEATGLDTFINTLLKETEEERKESCNPAKFHLSDAAKCIRAICFRMLGYPSEEEGEDPSLIFATGHALHRTVQRLLVNRGYTEKDHIEVPIKDIERGIEGSVDVVISGEQLALLLGGADHLPGTIEESYILELKSKGDKKLYTGESSFEKYYSRNANSQY
mgnify:CR=1 FL=1